MAWSYSFLTLAAFVWCIVGHDPLYIGFVGYFNSEDVTENQRMISFRSFRPRLILMFADTMSHCLQPLYVLVSGPWSIYDLILVSMTLLPAYFPP